MPDANILPDATTTDGAFLVLAIVLPAAGVLLSFVLGGRYAERIALVLRLLQETGRSTLDADNPGGAGGKS